MTKDEYFKLCTALVQEQVYAWGIASSFVCLGSPPGMADAMLLKPNWSIGSTIFGGDSYFRQHKWNYYCLVVCYSHM